MSLTLIRVFVAGATGGTLLAASSPAVAHLVRIVEENVTLDKTQSYEIVDGYFMGELEPSDPHNRIITDIGNAPRSPDGKVEYRATFRIARPVDPAKRTGVLMYDVPNRGNIITGYMRIWSGVAPAGHIWAVSGWQGDLRPRAGMQTATVPIARQPNGRAITGRILVRFAKVDRNTRSVPVIGGDRTDTGRPPALSLDTRKAQLWRETQSGQRIAIPSGDWAFADCSAKPFPGVPDAGKLCIRDGFDPNAAYDLAYIGKDPLVLGIGFAATRDLVSYLRSGRPDDEGRANPAGTGIRWTIGTGASQSGNFLRSFVHLGFNADEAGARVFDGINPQIAARQVPLNVRFGIPGGAASKYEAGSEGTLWWGRYEDTMRRRGPTSLLDRCLASGTCPKIVETAGSAEFWGLRLSPNFVGTDASRDIPLPDNVRRYYFPATAHGGSLGKGFLTQGDPRLGTCLLAGNPNPSEPNLHAVQKALLDWVVEGRQPPASRYPTLAAGELAPPTEAAIGWPAIPGQPTPRGKLNPFADQDFGPRFRASDLSGIADQPPVIRQILPSLVPRVDRDGNEASGVPSVYLLVPLGTYTGWNVETAGIGNGKGCDFVAGFIPFERTKSERVKKGDPRPSLEERYGTHDGFVEKVRVEAARQVATGWLLPEDAATIVADARASDVLK